MVMEPIRWFAIAADTSEVLGEILIAYAALRVNYRFRNEHKVDDRVFREMRREHRVALIGIGLLVFGYLLRWVGSGSAY